MNYIYTILYTCLCLLLFLLIIYFVSKNYIIIENFSYLDPVYSPYDINTDTPETNHNVNLPINTTSSCQNMCGPNSQCSITREQCTSDIDCYGCQPPNKENNLYYNPDIKGLNDAGRLIYNQNPQYSILTTDIGTQAAFFNKPYSKVPKPYLGVDKWMNSAAKGMQYYYHAQNYEYLTNPDKFKNLPKYKTRESITGLYEDYGPLAANAIL